VRPSHHTFKLEKTQRDYQAILGIFADVLEGLSEHTSAALVRGAAEVPAPTVPPEAPERALQLISMALQLLNLVEENADVQARRHAETERQETRAGTWAHTLATLTDRGLGEHDIAAMLTEVLVQPVLTAHPTEAKRRSMLAHHRELYLLLVKIENPIYSPWERDRIHHDIADCLERIWRTGEIYLQKPTVASERRNVIHYAMNVFPDALSVVDARLRHAWRHVGFDASLLASAPRLPRLSFGTWVGGDRDGHPSSAPRSRARPSTSSASRPWCSCGAGSCRWPSA
jgi:phosphoenolpyruvate carboxylase